MTTKRSIPLIRAALRALASVGVLATVVSEARAQTSEQSTPPPPPTTGAIERPSEPAAPPSIPGLTIDPRSWATPPSDHGGTGGGPGCPVNQRPLELLV
jgi:hypothetical protein